MENLFQEDQKISIQNLSALSAYAMLCLKYP